MGLATVAGEKVADGTDNESTRNRGGVSLSSSSRALDSRCDGGYVRASVSLWAIWTDCEDRHRKQSRPAGSDGLKLKPALAFQPRTSARVLDKRARPTDSPNGRDPLCLRACRVMWFLRVYDCPQSSPGRPHAHDRTEYRWAGRSREGQRRAVEVSSPTTPTTPALAQTASAATVEMGTLTEEDASHGRARSRPSCLSVCGAICRSGDGG